MTMSLQNNKLFVVTRFDLQKTWRELLIAVLVPSVMFIVSSATLCIFTRSVNVGDDTKMRCTSCIGSPHTNEDQRQATRNNTNECLLSPSDENVRTNSRYKYCNASRNGTLTYLYPLREDTII